MSSSGVGNMNNVSVDLIITGAVRGDTANDTDITVIVTVQCT